MLFTTEWKGIEMEIKTNKNNYIITDKYNPSVRHTYPRGDGRDVDILKAMDDFVRFKELTK